MRTERVLDLLLENVQEIGKKKLLNLVYFVFSKTSSQG